MFQNQEEVKSFAKGLRRELKAAYPADTPSHSQMLEFVAKAAGHESFGHLLAAMTTVKVVPSPAMEVEDPETGAILAAKDLEYRLFNACGSLDLAQAGALMSGIYLELMQDTVEFIPDCTASVYGVTRQAGVLDIEYAGDTEVNWDGQVPQKDSRGVALWVSGNGNQIAEDCCVVIPEGFCEEDDEDFYDADRCQSYAIPVRKALVVQVARYIREFAGNQTTQALGELEDKARDDFARDVGLSARSVLGRAQTAVGFRLHALELDALAEMLNK